jgi:Vitamin K-dependent gamma-carboxylase
MPAVWQNFWFKQIDARQFAALRIAFGLLSLIYFIQLVPYIDTQFSPSGWLGNQRQLVFQNGGSWSLFFFDGREHAHLLANLIIMAGILSALLMAVGWHSRMMALLTWLVWVSLWNRNPLLLDGDDAALKIMCFYLMLSPCGNAWSLDACRQPKPQYASVWPLRLMQFQVALIYFVSGWAKFHGQEWLDGSAIQIVLVHPHYSRWDGWAFVHTPFVAAVLSGLAWFIRWWEVLFPLLMLSPCTRKANLAIGVAFHLGLLVTMNLRGFAAIMLALYLALLADGCFLRVEGWFKKG